MGVLMVIIVILIVGVVALSVWYLWRKRSSQGKSTDDNEEREEGRGIALHLTTSDAPDNDAMGITTAGSGEADQDEELYKLDTRGMDEHVRSDSENVGQDSDNDVADDILYAQGVTARGNEEELET